MTVAKMLLLAVLAGVAAATVVGCGGAAGECEFLAGIYRGTVTGCQTGEIAFYVSPDGVLSGRLEVDGCADPVPITGLVDPAGNVDFGGSGCGFTITGTGTIERLQVGSSVFVGSGTYTATDDDTEEECPGTWTVRRTARTGSIG